MCSILILPPSGHMSINPFFPSMAVSFIYLFMFVCLLAWESEKSVPPLISRLMRKHRKTDKFNPDIL